MIATKTEAKRLLETAKGCRRRGKANSVLPPHQTGRLNYRPTSNMSREGLPQLMGETVQPYPSGKAGRPKKRPTPGHRYIN